MSPGKRATVIPLKQTKNPRSLLVDLSKRYGGASTRAVAVAKGLREWGATMATLDDSPVCQAARGQGIPVVTVGKSRVDPRIPFRLAGAVRDGPFQIIDTQNIQSKFWGSIAARLSGASLVSTLNSSYVKEQGGNWKGYLYSFIDRLTNRRVRRYIAVSESIRTWLCEGGVDGGQIELIHNGIEIPGEAAAGTARAVRSDLRLPENAILCTAVGRLVWAKGYSDLVEAFAQLAPRLPNAYCLIVGEGDLRAALEEQINRLGLAGRVLLLGYRQHADTLEILSSSDVFVMPSRSEGIPYALLEAGALGKPIVASRCGGIPEVVRDGREALLVEPANVNGIAGSLEALCMDPQKAGQLGERARARIRSDFSLEAQIESTKRAYLSAVQVR